MPIFRVKDMTRGSQKDIQVLETPFVVGRGQENQLTLADSTVSKKHCRIILTGGRLAVEDLDSRTGTSVNQQRIDTAVALRPGDVIRVGRHELELLGDETGRGAATSRGPGPLEGEKTRPSAVAVNLGDRTKIVEKIRAYPELSRLEGVPVAGEEYLNRARTAVQEILKQLCGESPADDSLVFGLLNEALGSGPLGDFLAQEGIDEIMINDYDTIYLESGGKVQMTSASFPSLPHLVNLVRRLLAQVGRRLDDRCPMVDARLPDGSRINVVLPPLSASGPLITIRRFRAQGFGMADLFRMGTLSKNMAVCLKLAMQSRRNIMISGGTGAGKSTLLRAMASFINPEERIITIEDAVELQLSQPHVLQLEAKAPYRPGEDSVSVRHLLINSLRMRPDRIIIGECRGGEALDMLQAMNTGHDGSLTTLHANSPRDALSRLETLVLMSGIELPIQAIRRQITSAIHLIVQQSRLADGSRKVVSISEITGLEGEIYTMHELFRFDNRGVDSEGRVMGEHQALGAIPVFIQDLRSRGIAVDLSIFQEPSPPSRHSGRIA